MAAVAETVEKEPACETEQDQAPEDHLALQMRLGGYLTGAVTSSLIELGDRLGLYAGLKTHGPCTAADLAGALGLAERYVLEWCRQQVGVGCPASLPREHLPAAACSIPPALSTHSALDF